VTSIAALKTKKRLNIDVSLTIFYAWRGLFLDAHALMAIRFVTIHYLTAVRALPPATFAHNFVKLLLMCQPCDVLASLSPARRHRSMLNINVICYLLVLSADTGKYCDPNVRKISCDIAFF
jgi:hypothetical protein